MTSGSSEDNDMLPEGEDLLQQLSGELGLPEFLEDVSMLDDPDTNSSSIYDQLMRDDATTSDLFDEPNSMLMEADFMTNHAASSVQDVGFNFTAFPPSPSNSDSSATSTVDSKEGVLLSPMSPPAAAANFASTNFVALGGASFINVSDLTNVKIPIPKIQKPSKLH